MVDLDGTLVRSDLLVESAFVHLGRNLGNIRGLVSAAAHGIAALKAKIASKTEIDPALLPYDEAILSIITERRKAGHTVYLASASNERYVHAVAAYLGLFDGWFASDGDVNLGSGAKARRLVEEFGEQGFDYIGNNSADLAVWSVASQAIAVRALNAVTKKLRQMHPQAVILERGTSELRSWLKLIRIHQWAKNALVFVPLVTARKFDLVSLGTAVGAAIAFSLLASAMYILNDLIDLEADRKHLTKRTRQQLRSPRRVL